MELDVIDCADDYGFAVLFAQQTRSNNANACCNWFEPGDIARDQREAPSVRQMIQTVGSRHDTDPGRVFLTALSPPSTPAGQRPI